MINLNDAMIMDTENNLPPATTKKRKSTEIANILSPLTVRKQQSKKNKTMHLGLSKRKFQLPESTKLSKSSSPTPLTTFTQLCSSDNPFESQLLKQIDIAIDTANSNRKSNQIQKVEDNNDNNQNNVENYENLLNLSDFFADTQFPNIINITKRDSNTNNQQIFTNDKDNNYVNNENNELLELEQPRIPSPPPPSSSSSSSTSKSINPSVLQASLEPHVFKIPTQPPRKARLKSSQSSPSPPSTQPLSSVLLSSSFPINQSSQIFLNDVKNANIKIVQEKIKIGGEWRSQSGCENDVVDNGVENVIENKKNSSKYIQLQRAMEAINSENLNDEFVDTQLSNAYRSSQYRRDVVSVFDQCEKSICDIPFNSILDVDNVNGDDSDEYGNINDFNWSSQFGENEVMSVKAGTSTNVTGTKPTDDFQTPQTEMNDPTTLIRQRLENLGQRNSKKTVEQNLLYESAILAPVSSYLFMKMGPFFDLPLKVKKLIKDFKGIDELYDWQIECLKLPSIKQRKNLIYALPTSGGKTLVAEIIILKEIICRRKNCIFLLPYVSIVQEKIWALSPFAVALDFLVEEYAAGKGPLPPRKRRKKRSVYIATIEKGLALLNSLIENDRANEIGLIVIDELHIIGELGRGATLETLITKAKFIKAGIQIVGMSATIGNLNEIARFMDADTYTRDFRPVELKEYIKCGPDILVVNPQANQIDQAFIHVRTVNFGYKDAQQKMDPDHVAGLVSEVIPKNSCLIFCPSKKNCENLSLLLTKLLSKKYQNHRKDEKQALMDAIINDSGPICKVLSQTIPSGIAYHHSGLTSDERRHLEDAFRRNILCVICCTSTLAAGVNLPAKRVIIRSPYVGRDFLTLSKYKQMIGRAGRAGMGDIGESILICSAKDNIRISELLCSPMDEATSTMHMDDAKGLRQLIVSGIGLELAINRITIYEFISTTLFAVQAKRLDINKGELLDRIITKLIREKIINAKQQQKNVQNFSVTATDIRIESQDSVSYSDYVNSSANGTDDCKVKINGKPKRTVILKPSTTLEISKLGRASFKSCIDLKRSQIIYKDLVQAQKSLVLLDNLHLLYIVTPYEPEAISVYPDMTVYYAKYLKLEPKHLETAKVLGITESHAMRMMSGKPFKGEMNRIINRFFFTLILYELWMLKPVHEVAESFHINRGVVQNLITASASYSSCLVKFCEEIEEFWAFKELLNVLTKRLSYCCTNELIPLMELPCVKLGRAKQLYAAGYKNLQSIARASPQELVEIIEHLNHRVARQLISAAKILLLERVETLREEVQDCLDVLEKR